MTVHSLAVTPDHVHLFIEAEPPLDAWRFVDDPDTAALIDAAAIVAGDVAGVLTSRSLDAQR